MTAKVIKQAYNLGITVEPVGESEYNFSATVLDGPWWGTEWSGLIDIYSNKCYIYESPRHPHVYKGELCFHNNENSLSGWIQALHTVWHQTTWEDTWKLNKCVEEMIQGFSRSGEPDLLAEFRWIKKALKKLDAQDGRIAYYRELVSDLVNQ